ncbi:AraC family transcriptional regulator [Paenibacillus cymbidii]|uniref:AraC family transcriptional regulator n=1 Tax=Paenibacillus cymbidii TaxID=1639034 RepID=UPI0010817EAC|nr:AraC family transcriptional regulator [Paenibacillus cymbidii]
MSKETAVTASGATAATAIGAVVATSAPAIAGAGANPAASAAAELPLDRFLFRLCGAERVRLEKGARLEQQLSLSHALIMGQGQARLSVGEQSWRLRGDTVYICPPEQTFGAAGDKPADAAELLIVRFDVFEQAARSRNRLRRVKAGGPLPAGGELRLQAADMPALAAQFETIRGLSGSPAALERFRAQLALQELLYRIGKLGFGRRGQADATTGLERAKRHIDRHFAEPLPLDQLARLAEISPKYFGELFKKTFGDSVGDYIAALRINEAKRLMARAEGKLREIAHQVGYGDEFYFSRKFKKETGIAPSEYMQSRRRRIAVDRPALIGQLLPLHIVPFAAPLHPKWSAHYYEHYRHDIPIHLDAFMADRNRSGNFAALQGNAPDIIISSLGESDADREKLARIAPVFCMPEEEGDCRTQLRRLAALLGESDEAERWLAQYNRKAEAARRLIERAAGGERWLTLRVLKRTVYASCNRNMAEVLFGDLQVANAWADERPMYEAALTPEWLAALAPDRLLVLVCQETETLAFWQSFQQSAAWRQLRAVRDGKAHAIPSDPWREYSALAQERIVDHVGRIVSGECP